MHPLFHNNSRLLKEISQNASGAARLDAKQTRKK